MNPRKLGSLADTRQEAWKLPLPEFIVKCYRKRFGRSEPTHVRSLEEVVQAAAGRLVLLYLPTYSPWLNPIEMLWRHFRREVTHCELFESMQALLIAAREFFHRSNLCPSTLLSVIGSHAAKVV